jgi:anti-anti-sigma factor
MTTTYRENDYAQIRDEVSLSVLRRPAHTIARLRGELDVGTAPALRERLAALLRRRMRLLVLDLSEIRFCDAAGLAVLIGVQRRARLFGITLRLAAPGSQVANVLSLTGLDRSLSIHPTLAGALAQPLTRHAAMVTPPIRRLRNRFGRHSPDGRTLR